MLWQFRIYFLSIWTIWSTKCHEWLLCFQWQSLLNGFTALDHKINVGIFSGIFSLKSIFMNWIFNIEIFYSSSWFRFGYLLFCQYISLSILVLANYLTFLAHTDIYTFNILLNIFSSYDLNSNYQHPPPF